MIYLDHNATTPLDGRVLEAMLPFLGKFYGNPSSLYRHGRLARSAIDTAREQVAALVDAPAASVIFTSGGTEANNLALAAVPRAGKLAVGITEHPSIIEPAKRLARQGHELAFIGVDGNGQMATDANAKLMAFSPQFVAMMLANNETGVVQDIAAYTQEWRDRGIIVHTDAVQAVGKMAVSFRRLGVNSLSLSSHKIHGPKGGGALVFDKSVPINPLLLGGGQEQNLRSGTENVAAIVGFGKAAELAKAEWAERRRQLLALRRLLEENLLKIQGLTLFAQAAERLPNTVQFGLPGVDGEMLLMKLDQKGIAVSSGSACASGGGEPSPVLVAMGVDADLAKSALRVSLGVTNTVAEIYEFVNVFKSLVGQA